MRNSRTRPALAAALASGLALSALAVPRADADTGWLATTQLFGATATGGVDTAMAGDGTVLVGRAYPDTDGDVVVQVRPPGGELSSTTLQAAAPGKNPSSLDVTANARGDLGATWFDGDGYVASIRPAGSTTWIAAVPLAGSTYGETAMEIDGTGRLWVGTETGSFDGSERQVEILAADGTIKEVALAAPDPDQYESKLALDVTPSGVGRVALIRSRESGTGNGNPCSLATEVVVGDVVATASTASLTAITSSTRTGTVVSGSCNLVTGSTLDWPDVLDDTNGNTVVTFQRANGALADVEALTRPAGGSFPTLVEFVKQTGDQVPTALIQFAGTVASVQRNGTTGVSSVSFRVDGSWATSNDLNPGAGVGSGFPIAAGGPRSAVFAWSTGAPQYQVRGSTISVDGPMREVTLGHGTNGFPAAVGVDLAGNGVLTYLDATGPTKVGVLVPFDNGGPRLSGVVIPKQVERGRATRFKATPVDVWAPSTAPSVWRFDGGGATLEGNSVTKTFTTTGKHTVEVTATDAIGNLTTRTVEITVADTIAPRFTQAPKVTPKRPEPGSRPFASFAVDETGGAVVVLTARIKGTSVTKKVTILYNKAGAKKVRLPALAAARWTAKVTLSDRSGNTRATSVTFTVAS